MNRFISREKMSKKERRKLDQTQRQTWAISPVSRTVKNKKVYDRKKTQRWLDDAPGLLLYTKATGKMRDRVFNQ